MINPISANATATTGACAGGFVGMECFNPAQILGGLGGAATAAATGATPGAAKGPAGKQFLRALIAAGRELDTQNPATAQHTAAQLASELFFKPVLAEMRQFPLGREFGGGGRTEEVFGEQLDQRLADSAAASAKPLVNQLTRYFQKFDQANRPVQQAKGRSASG